MLYFIRGSFGKGEVPRPEHKFSVFGMDFFEKLVSGRVHDAGDKPEDLGTVAGARHLAVPRAEPDYSNAPGLCRQAQKLLAFTQRLFGPEAFGNVVLHADKGRQTPVFSVHGRNVEFVPERRSVFAIVLEDRPILASLAYGGSQPFQVRLILILALQESAVMPQHFVRGIAGYPLEGGVDVDDRRVRQVRIRDDYAVRTGLDRVSEHES